MVLLQDISENIIRFGPSNNNEERDLRYFLSRIMNLFPEENFDELSLNGMRIRRGGGIEYIEYIRHGDDKAKKL